jgi:protein SCO1/2
MKRLALLLVITLSLAMPSFGSERYSAKGLVIKVDKANNSIVLSCEKIPGYMEAMEMPFTVRDPRELADLKPGLMVKFTLVVTASSSYVEGIHIRYYEGVEQDPLGARRLKLMASVNAASPPKPLIVGSQAPVFTLIDQQNQKVSLSQFRGKIVAITFTYTHCALPNFCFRTANNFRLLQKRFSSNLGNDMVFMTVTFDPVHDTPEVMAKYGKSWNANYRGWRLLSGPKHDVDAVCDKFGISHWADEGLITHSLHTILLDRQGNVVADLEGNEYTADQLGDLVQTALAR